MRIPGEDNGWRQLDCQPFRDRSEQRRVDLPENFRAEFLS